MLVDEQGWTERIQRGESAEGSRSRGRKGNGAGDGGAGEGGVEEERREGEVFQLDGANSDPEFILSISARWSGKELDAALGSPFAILTPRNSPLLRRTDPHAEMPRAFRTSGTNNDFHA